MDGELREDLQVPEGIQEYESEDSISAEPLIRIDTEELQESILVQREDGSWEHAENSPFSPFYVPDRKQKKNNRITIALVAFLLVVLIAGMIFAVSKLVEAAMGEATIAWKESSSVISEIWNEFKNELQDELGSDFEAFDDFTEYEEYEDFEEEYGDFYYQDGIYTPRPEDEYYLELADSIRAGLPYSVDFEYYQVSDYDEVVEIGIRYAQVDGDIPAIDEINGYLKDGAMYYATYFDSIYATNLWLNVTSYVTYMDESRLSVVVDERYIYEDEQYYNLYCMNFDLTTGTLLYNTDIIEASEELAMAFREQSDYQNGESMQVSQYPDEEIMELLSDEETLILYYTPVGLEIGYNLYDGWITATFKDYNKYLKKI